MTKNKNKRKRWMKNRLRSQARLKEINARLKEINRTERFNEAIDKIFRVGRYKD